MSNFDRFVTSFDLGEMETLVTDIAIFGSGIAGLSVACALPAGQRVMVFSKGLYSDGSTPYAQGGIAAAVSANDDPSLHAEDTIQAAVGLADPLAVATLTTEAPSAIAFLQHHGAAFDREGDKLSLTLEGGHSRGRIVHAGGDATGAELSRALFTSALERQMLIVNDAFLVDLLLDENGVAAGAITLIAGKATLVRFSSVVLASGGAGQLYSTTTSPSTCTGDGMAVAYRAGAELADMEFIQFHPTVMVSENDPRPLISEALRGEGAVLRDETGSRFMEGVHPLGDLAPRDVVARSMVKVMLAHEVGHLYLDATSIATQMPTRFPTIFASLRRQGIDPSREFIPVSPAAHYTIGGIRTSIDGETSISGLYAVGEAASVGIHGANRLASNSLLEGVVFGRRIASHIEMNVVGGSKTTLRMAREGSTNTVGRINRDEVRHAMERYAGVVRTGSELVTLQRQFERLADLSTPPVERAIEDANMVLLGSLIAQSALARHESRGAHYRSDMSETDPAMAFRQIVQRGDEGSTLLSTMTPAGYAV
jgi:L-aspartate oxidase